AEVILPDAIDPDAGGERVLRAGDPVGEDFAPARGLRARRGAGQSRRLGWRDGRKARPGLIALGLPITPAKHDGLARRRAALREPQRLGRPGRGSLLQSRLLLAQAEVLLQRLLADVLRHVLLDDRHAVHLELEVIALAALQMWNQGILDDLHVLDDVG